MQSTTAETAPMLAKRLCSALVLMIKSLVLPPLHATLALCRHVLKLIGMPEGAEDRPLQQLLARHSGASPSAAALLSSSTAAASACSWDLAQVTAFLKKTSTATTATAAINGTTVIGDSSSAASEYYSSGQGVRSGGGSGAAAAGSGADLQKAARAMSMSGSRGQFSGAANAEIKVCTRCSVIPHCQCAGVV
jgi:hypothetical protein